MSDVLQSVCTASAMHDDITFIVEVNGYNAEIKVYGADHGLLLSRLDIESLNEYDFETVLKGMIYSLRGFVDEQ